jgi:hypothetical protein
MNDLHLQINNAYPGIGVRYTTAETTVDIVTGEQKPLLEITDRGDVLHVSFIRATGRHRLGSLLNKTLAYAQKHGFRRVELCDDALFATAGSISCVHRALFHRAFEGKPGIYESKGWRPLVNTAQLIQRVSTYTKAQARDLMPGQGFSADDHTPFGAWVNAQPCQSITRIYNRLIIQKADGRFSEPTQQFLRALHELKRANEVLQHDPMAIATPTGSRLKTPQSHPC